VVAGAVTLRLAAEMSRSRVAVTVLTAAVACRAAGYLIQHDWLLHASGVFLVLYQVGAALLGNILLLLALGVYARYVYRDAHGEIQPRVREPRRASRRPATESTTPVAKPAPATKPALTTSATMRIDKPHGNGPAAVPARAAQAASSPAAPAPEKRRALTAAAVGSARMPASAAPAPESEDDATLSRSERRRLRKLQRRGHQPTLTLTTARAPL
jgi:hypothetical protein